jgi:hypothetical protein
MTYRHPLWIRLPAWSDWLSLVLMSFAAPLIAAFFHSAWVFHRGIRLYNAEIGGEYFRGNDPVPVPSFSTLLMGISILAIPAIPTFLVLLPGRQRTFVRWTIWAGCVALWIYMCFQMEVAYH